MRLAAVLAVVLLAYPAYRLFGHSEPAPPAVVTRTMDAHRLLSPGLGTRLDRLVHGRTEASRGANARVVALTFDDGPYPVETPLLLDVLADAHVRATFFLIGRDAEQFPDLTRRIAAGGHEIANHTLTHPNLDELGAPGVRRELEGGAAALERLVRDRAIRSMMRPPHGRFTEETVRTAQGAGYDVILWTDDPGDWRSVPPEAIAEHIAQNATAPDIVLLHSGRVATIAMLPRLIERFRRAGFSFVTVGELLARMPAAAIDRPLRVPL